MEGQGSLSGYIGKVQIKRASNSSFVGTTRSIYEHRGGCHPPGLVSPCFNGRITFSPDLT